MKKSKKLLLIIAIILLVALIGTGVSFVVIANSVVSSMTDVRIEKSDYELSDFALVGESITVSTNDDISINAYVIENAQSKANVILLHGMHGMDATSLFPYAKFIYDAGYTPICVDMRAHGNSGGEVIGLGYLETQDVLAVIDYIKQDDSLKTKPIVLYGLSMGGSTAINTAANSTDIAGIIADSPYMSYQAQVSDYMSRDGSSDLFIKTFMPAINTVLRFKLGINPKKNTPEKSIAQFDTPILLVHGDKDTQTNVYHSEELYDLSSSQDKELVIVSDADHLIVEDVLSQDAQDYTTMIIDWLDTRFAPTT